MKTLESLVKKAVKPLKNLAKATPLLGALAAHDANSEVVFTIETMTEYGFPTRVFTTGGVGDIMQANVYAETTETNDSRVLKWKVRVSPDLSLWDVPQPSPYLGQNDFFKGCTMSIANSTSPDDSWRSTISSSPHPSKKRGLVGVFKYYVSTTLTNGPRSIEVYDTLAKDFNLNVQPSSGSKITLELVPNFNSLTNRPKLFIDRIKVPDKSLYVPNVFVDFEAVGNKWILKACPSIPYNLSTAVSLSTNDFYRYDPLMSGPFSFRDDQSTNYPNARFYFAEELN